MRRQVLPLLNFSDTYDFKPMWSSLETDLKVQLSSNGDTTTMRMLRKRQMHKPNAVAALQQHFIQSERHSPDILMLDILILMSQGS